MKVKWTKEKPTEEGWYWTKYRNKHNENSICPATVLIMSGTTHVHTAGGVTFIDWGSGMVYAGAVDKSVRFGPRIEAPDN